MSSRDTKHKYRDDIQGLRGFSVLIVVLYHTGFLIRGGFVGVDLFFAISGFVVANLIFDSDHSDPVRFIKDFFTRRIKRLMPLFVLVNATTLFFSVFLLSPFGEIQQVVKALVASCLLVANFHFQASDAYWNLVVHPLRHMWSLSVEEQFYIFFPILVICVSKMFKTPKIYSRVWFILLTFIALASLVVCLYSTKNSARLQLAGFGFFSSPTRAWEFLAGVISFEVHRNFKQKIRLLYGLPLAILGHLLLIWSILNIHSAVGWPSWQSAPLIFGICLLLIFGSEIGMWNYLLKLKPLVWIGDRSYGWYLWHWPILVFGRIVFGESRLVAIFLALFSLLLAVVTKPLIEDRFRYSSFRNQNYSIRLILAAQAILVVLSVVVYALASTGLGLNESATESGLGLTTQYELGGCYDEPVAVSDVLEFCTNSLDAQHLDVLIIGDSQAPSISDGVFAAGRKLGLVVAGVGLAGCPFAATTPLYGGDKCNNFQRLYFDLILRLRPQTVIVAQRADAYISDFKVRPQVAIPMQDGSIPHTITEQRSSLLNSYVTAINKISNLPLKVIIFAETRRVVMPPQSLFDELTGNKIDSQMNLANQSNQIRDDLLIDFKYRYQKNPNVIVVDASGELCDSKLYCPAVVDKTLRYRDSFHLNSIGSASLEQFWIDILGR